MNHLLPTTAILASSLAVVACSAGQTDKASRRVLKAKATATLTDSTVENSVGIEAGSLRDTTVTIPGGALAIGTSVTMHRGLAPDDFAISGSSAASSPLVFSAQQGGEEIGEADQPMKIAIPIASSSLALAEGYDDLVVLLKDIYDNLVIWQRDKIAVVDQKAVFQTKKFGTYQLVRLGASAPASTDFASTDETAPPEKSEESGSTSGSGTTSDPAPTPAPAPALLGDPQKFAELQAIMQKGCVHSSCHGDHQGSQNLTAVQAHFEARKTAVAQRMFVDKNMAPTSQHFKPGTSQGYDVNALSTVTPLTDAQKILFVQFLQSIGVNVPPQ